MKLTQRHLLLMNKLWLGVGLLLDISKDISLLLDVTDQEKLRLAFTIFLLKHRLNLELFALFVFEVENICRLPVN